MNLMKISTEWIANLNERVTEQNERLTELTKLIEECKCETFCQELQEADEEIERLNNELEDNVIRYILSARPDARGSRSATSRKRNGSEDCLFSPLK